MSVPVEENQLVVSTYQPELLSRRGEITAWVLTLILLVVLFSVRTRLPDLPLGAYLFLGFFVFAAVSISLGNWMDRQTTIRLDSQGIAYKNGLRHSYLGWDQVEKVMVRPSQLGDKVYVVGTTSHFYFRMMGEIKYQGRTRGRVGFQNGDQILRTILERSGLRQVESEAPDREYVRG